MHRHAQRGTGKDCTIMNTINEAAILIWCRMHCAAAILGWNDCYYSVRYIFIITTFYIYIYITHIFIMYNYIIDSIYIGIYINVENIDAFIMKIYSSCISNQAKKKKNKEIRGSLEVCSLWLSTRYRLHCIAMFSWKKKFYCAILNGH